MRNFLLEVRADFKRFGALERLIFILMTGGILTILIVAIALLIGLFTGQVSGNNIPLI